MFGTIGRAFLSGLGGMLCFASLSAPANAGGPGAGGERTSASRSQASQTQASQTQGQGARSEPGRDREAIVRIEAAPTAIELHGPDDRRQLIVSGWSDAGDVRDLTRQVHLELDDPTIASIRGTVVIPTRNGGTTLLVTAGDLRRRVPVRVEGMEEPSRLSLRTDVLPALSKQGCSSGACHGAPSGKGNFRLSLRAFDADLDRKTLTREGFGRRVNPIEPEQSLLLLKPLMQVSHGGGKRLSRKDPAYQILRRWIAQGAQPDRPDRADCVRLQVFPGDKRTLQVGGGQQLSALAHFSDRGQRGVTELAVYESSAPEVATVDERGWITPKARGETVILVRYLEHIEAVPLMVIEPVPGFQWEAPEAKNYIDELVHAKLKQLKYVPSPACSDEAFIRRVFLDVLGTLPSVEQTRAFLADGTDDKRARLIDSLLERDEFAEFWALKWGDLLKMSVKTLGEDGAHKYHRWLKNAIGENLPYDEFARQLLTAGGSTFVNPAANFYRAAEDMNACVEAVSQVFLGSRLQCAKCHNHPFEPWTQDNYYGLAAFFNRVRRTETSRGGEWFVSASDTGEVVQPRTGQQLQPWLPGRGSETIESERDRREVFAAWLTSPQNPYFARMQANRIWAQLFARGIVEPIDDFRSSNPPANAALLDALAEDLIASGFDRKHLLRTILNSQTYQASHRTGPLNRGDRTYFSHQVPRLLPAEPLFDAIHHTLGLRPDLAPLPAGTRATQLPAPDLVASEFLKSFGQPARTTSCACERTDEPNLGMSIELLNGDLVRQRLGAPNNRFRQALADGQTIEQAVEELYLAALCRKPTADELRVAQEHCAAQASTAAGLEDVCWALLNSDEFLFQH